MDESDTISRVTVRNDRDLPMDLIFEPWAAVYDLPPGTALILEARSPRPGWLQVEVGLKAATVYAWDACVAAVYREDGQLVESLDVRVPDYPSLSRVDKPRDDGNAP